MHILNRVGILPALLRKRGDSFILMFHAIGEHDVPLAAFRRMLVELGEVFEFRPISDFVTPNAPTSRPAIYLTFDDGLMSQYEFAYPVLQEMSIPAAFYVCPQLIESGTGIWTYEFRAMLDTMGETQRFRLASELGLDTTKPFAILDHVLAFTPGARQEVEQLARELMGSIQVDPETRRRLQLMGWPEIEALDPGLITLGSHTLSHAMVDSLTAEEAEDEIVGSRRMLENRLDREVAHFCYPNGRIGPLAEQFVRAAYLTAVTTFTTRLPPHTADPHRLPRIGAAGHPSRMWWKMIRTNEAGVEDG